MNMIISTQLLKETEFPKTFWVWNNFFLTEASFLVSFFGWAKNE